MGAQLGGEWKAFKHLNVYADLTWGLNDIFKKDFDTQHLQCIYLLEYWVWICVLKE